MQARTTVWARMPADGQALLDDNATARTRLARVGGRHRYDPPTGACCLVGEDTQERRPARVLDRLGKVVIPEQVGRLQIFMIDRVILSHERQRRLVVKILPLTLHLLMRLGKQRHGFPAPIAAFLAASDSSLRSFERPLNLALPTRMEDARAI